jgi:hypothetical protein
LLLGSPLVLLAVVMWAAIDWAMKSAVAPPSPKQPIMPVFRFVNIGRDRDGGIQPNANIWQTSTALEDCAEIIDRRHREEKKRIADLMSSVPNSPLNREDENACAPFQLGEVEEGTKVEILGECGQMAKVKILSGSLQGREGCIQTGRLGKGGG